MNGNVKVAILLAGTVMLAGLVWWWALVETTPYAPVDPSLYEGRGGSYLSASGVITVPDLGLAARTTRTFPEVLRLRGQPVATAVRLLGPADERLSPTAVHDVLLWHDALPIPDPKPKQWPVAHVCCTTAIVNGAAQVVRVEVIGSLGRIEASNPSID